MIFFDDIDVGTRTEHGSVTVTREEIIDFATKYDPQPFHLSDEAAAMTPFGKIAASGWNTCALTMRVLVDSWKEQQAMGLGSPGLDELRWLKPVYPGDTLHVASEVVEKKPSRSKPHIGSMWSDILVTNQHGELVLKFRSIVMMLRKTAGAPQLDA
ncbi:MaoC family dehydratase [Sphingomicrobium sp. B8]|uniref:MaoC family dehydratase n=2 Tax=Sphingomicrobium clamense TaxID=2851013 RepID=A0ABS6V5J2_9SPHN|nr:MaoC family dehydratase [Sphingomicrobium sp. B8]MBW0144813.1 MaoC family dehydratase [Sphingomicrobium sp. B8]